MAITSAQIQGWIQSNPNATPEQIAQIMAENQLTAQDVAQAVGTAPFPNAPVEVKKAQLDAWAGTAGQYANDANTALMMQNFALSPQDIASTSNIPLGDIQYRYDTGLASTTGVTPGQATDAQIRTWMAGNPQATPTQMLAAIEQFKVDPQQFTRATGVDIQDLYSTQAGNIPTGLLGYERAINQGLGSAVGTLNAAQSSSRNDLMTAQQQIASLYGLNISDLQSAGQTARDDLTTAFGNATGYFAPYQAAGTRALTLQEALSGASGQAAFDSAYQESPYIAFLREQGMRANLAGAAATGGLGGGNVQLELNRFGQGLASQGLQTQIGNLQNISGMGLNAAGSAANIQAQYGTNLADVGMRTAGSVADQRGNLAGYTSQTGANLSNIGQQTGVNIANLQGAAGVAVANNRQRFGELMQSSLESNATQRAEYANQQGTNLAGIYQGQTNNLQNLNYNAANNYANNVTGLAGAQASALSGQPYTQAPVNNYGAMWGNAIQQGASIYDLAKGASVPNPAFNPYAGNSSANSIDRGVNNMQYTGSQGNFDPLTNRFGGISFNLP
jgi:hypothetical protein